MLLFVLALAGLFLLYYLLACIYRLTVHPLAKYPGPWRRAVSYFPQAASHASGDSHVHVQALHEEFGDLVRIAPDALSFRSANAVHAIYDRKANVVKTGWTDVSMAINPTYNTHALSNRQLHSKRRRLLANAFSDSALKNLEHFVIDRVNTFNELMGQPKDARDADTTEKDNWSKPRDMSKWANNLTLDVLGELCFGKTFGALEAGTHMAAELLLATAWLSQALAFLPGRHLIYPILRNQALMQKVKSKTIRQKLEYRAMMVPLLKERFALEAELKEKDLEPRHDFMHYMIQAKDPETGDKFSPPDLVGEAALLVGAGSDTTSTCIAATLFYLVRHPDVLQKLQDEVRAAFNSVDEIKTSTKLSQLTYLKACIDEGLRMSPPVPGILHRRVLPGGMEIDGKHVPAGTIVGSSAYAVHHSETHFPRSFEYVPERWIPGSTGLGFPVTQSTVEFQKQAFIPFSTGPRNCVGKNMAVMELLITFARVVYLYDMRKMPGDRSGEGAATKKEGRRREEEYQLVDYFIAKREGPVVEFRKREGLAAG